MPEHSEIFAVSTNPKISSRYKKLKKRGDRNKKMKKYFNMTQGHFRSTENQFHLP